MARTTIYGSTNLAKQASVRAHRRKESVLEYAPRFEPNGDGTRGDTEERSFWRRTLESLEHRDGDLDHAVGLMTRHGALRDTVARAGHYGAIARDALGIFPDSADKRALIEVVDFCIRRGH